jgi:hypothetical protein
VFDQQFPHKSTVLSCCFCSGCLSLMNPVEIPLSIFPG